MEDLSVYQWLILGMLAVITLCALSATFVYEKVIREQTEQLERAIENLADELKRP